MAWSGLVQMHLVWQQASMQNTLGQVPAECNLAHYQFPTFRLGSFLPQTAWTILCKTSLQLIWFWLTVSGLGQMDLVWKQAGVQESLGLLPANSSELIWIGCKSDPACLLGSCSAHLDHWTTQKASQLTTQCYCSHQRAEGKKQKQLPGQDCTAVWRMICEFKKKLLPW